jgi:hexokinase
MDVCGNIPKLAHLNLDPSLPMAINCEWGAFDNQHVVLPRTPYDVMIDEDSPRPGQQTFEKMVAGLYLGEIFRLALLDVHGNPACSVFEGQDVSKLAKPYSLDSSFLSAIEELVNITIRHSLPTLTSIGIHMKTFMKLLAFFNAF